MGLLDLCKSRTLLSFHLAQGIARRRSPGPGALSRFLCFPSPSFVCQKQHSMDTESQGEPIVGISSYLMYRNPVAFQKTGRFEPAKSKRLDKYLASFGRASPWVGRHDAAPPPSNPPLMIFKIQIIPIFESISEYEFEF